MEEVQFQQTGCTSAECAIQIGKVLAVKKMVVGTVSRLGKKYFITVRMVDVETSQIDLATSIGIAAPIEELPSHVNKLIEKMIGSLNN
jgi:TolB-like protein